MQCGGERNDVDMFCVIGAACSRADRLEQAPRDDMLWIAPKFRAEPRPEPYQSVTTTEQFRIAKQDIFDRGTIALAAIFASEGQLTNSNRPSGRGAEGLAHYLATAYADMASVIS